MAPIINIGFTLQEMYSILDKHGVEYRINHEGIFTVIRIKTGWIKRKELGIDAEYLYRKGILFNEATIRGGVHDET